MGSSDQQRHRRTYLACVAGILALNAVTFLLPLLNRDLQALVLPVLGLSLPALVALGIWQGRYNEQLAKQAAEPAPLPAEPEQPQATFDFDVFSKKLLQSNDPVIALRVVVSNIRQRESAALKDRTSPKPAGIELFLARALEEAGLFADDVELPTMHVVRPQRTQFFYVRIEQPRLTYRAKLRVLSLEAALNRLYTVWITADDPQACSVEECYRICQRMEASVHFQSRKLSDAIGPAGGEWGVCLAISTAIESFKLPHRLEAKWRTCVRNRSAAFVLDVTPAEAFPASAYVEELGRVVPTTQQMREQAASAYAMRLALLVGACALDSCPQLMNVSVAAVLDNARKRRCLYSVRLDRRVVRFVLPDSELTPEQALRVFDANLELVDGVLQPVEQGFALEDEEFCPAWRYEKVELSDRPLLYDASTTLGATRTGDLGIAEEAHREDAATKIARRLTDSTEENVRAVIEVAGQSPDLTVRDAASRIVSKLVAGEIPEEDPYALMTEFVEGDEMSQAVRRAWQRLTRGDAEAAVRILEGALAPAEAVGTYADTDEVAYRSFRSYADRVLYNRLMAKPGQRVELVPASYYGAHLLAASLLVELDKPERALVHAKRALELAPEDLHPYLVASRCHEDLGNTQAACDVMGRLLEVAHDPEAAGMAYLRLGTLMRTEDRPLVAEACLRKCLEFYSSAWPLAFSQITELIMEKDDPQEQLSDLQIEGLLLANGIPMAPTERILKTLLDCARASLDAELFPVARTFAHILGRFSGDDVITGLVRSIEDEPDR